MITTPEIWKMIAEETAKLNAIGYYPKRVSSIVFKKMITFYATINYNSALLTISEYYLNAPVEEFRATIMHELIHVVPESGYGHGKAWKNVASKVSKAYPQYNIRRCGSNLADGSSFNLRAVSRANYSQPKRVYTIKCEDCGKTWTRYRRSRLSMHPECYHCNCGGKLYLLS